MAELNDNRSLTEVVNSALVGIGNNLISDLYDDNDGTAKLCRVLVMQCIKEVQSHPSGCWDELVAYDELVANDKAYQKEVRSYNLPLGCMSVRWVKDENNLTIPFKVIGRSLKTPYKAKYICFVRFSENPEEWSSEMTSCVIGLMSAKLLAAIAKDFSASRQAVEAFWAAEFPRWAGSRINKAETPIPGQDAELSVLWGESSATSLTKPDWY